ncbi:MAG: hypothetical protein K2G51_00030 [Lachnospiraceae bacterium]|nr:hypothetical protein [Lachnospiraceae bacterium]MDE7273175.1 hypothetical protein [Lachnospiraceae bacterium]
MKKGKILGLLAMSAVLLTGCVDSMPELTAEQSDIIAEYAAGLLLKYSSRYDYKIVSEEEVAAAIASRQEISEPETQQEQETVELSDDIIQSEVTPESPAEEPEEINQVQLVADLDFAAELGIDDLIIRYQSFEICDSYPQNNSGFGVSAVQDKKLLVMHFDLEGLPEEDIDCNLLDYDIRMRVNINDTTSAVVLSTMILNDITSYVDVVHAGDIVDVVAVAEIDDMAEENIQTLTLWASANGQSCTVKLK